MSSIDMASAQVGTSRRARPTNALQRNRMRWGLLFLSPWLVGFVCFQFLPIIATLFLSFTDYSATKALALENFNFVGLDNYRRVFTDPVFGQSLGVTLRFALLAVPLGLVVPLFFAVLLNSKHLLAKNVFRTLFYAPTVIPVVAGAMIFGGVLNAQSGWINLSLEAIGIQGPRWMADPSWALPALNLLSLWGVGNAMLILLASLQGVPTDILEAATVDGANWFQRFLNVTLPMISPVIFYNITLGVINAFQYFVPAMLLGGRNGDPDGATLFYNLHFYREAFVFNEMGYASVLAIVLFVLVMIMTSIMFYWGQRQVYYAGAER